MEKNKEKEDVRLKAKKYYVEMRIAQKAEAQKQKQ